MLTQEPNNYFSEHYPEEHNYILKLQAEIESLKDKVFELDRDIEHKVHDMVKGLEILGIDPIAAALTNEPIPIVDYQEFDDDHPLEDQYLGVCDDETCDCGYVEKPDLEDN